MKVLQIWYVSLNMPTRVSSETSFASKQLKSRPKLVSALSKTKHLFRLFRFFAETGFGKTTFVRLAYLGSHIKFEGLSLTNKKVIPCRISISLLAGNKVYGNNFLICEWKPTKFKNLGLYCHTLQILFYNIFQPRGCWNFKICRFWTKYPKF